MENTDFRSLVKAEDRFRLTRDSAVIRTDDSDF